MKKEEWITRKRYREHIKVVSIPRCARCKSFAEKDELLTIPGLFILVASGFGCYLGYLIRGEGSWVMYATGIGVFLVLVIFFIFWQSRCVYRMPENLREAYNKWNEKNVSSHPDVNALQEAGWK